MPVIVGERQQRIDEKARIFRTGLHALAGNFAVNLEGFEVVLGDAITIRVHIGKSPARAGMTLFSRVAIRLDSIFLLAILIGFEAELEKIERARFLGKRLN